MFARIPKFLVSLPRLYALQGLIYGLCEICIHKSPPWEIGRGWGEGGVRVGSALSCIRVYIAAVAAGMIENVSVSVQDRMKDGPGRWLENASFSYAVFVRLRNFLILNIV